MKNKATSLIDMVKLSDNPNLSKKYINYLCGLDESKEYRHQEIMDISKMVKQIRVSPSDLAGFIYGYTVPQLNKEFDLVKISESTCINIELKSGLIDTDKIERQLLQNRHYLKMLGKADSFFFTYTSESNSIYKLNESKIEECSFFDLEVALNGHVATNIDLDAVFTPNNILVSPLNNPQKFLMGNYLLTENQENIKKQIIKYILTNNHERFVGLTGGPGTGKTLLIYDLAKELSKDKRVLLVHSGILCAGHNYLNEHLNNMKIISAKALRLREISNADIVIVDESHRLYESILDKIDRWVKKTDAICIFSYDVGQKLSNAENRMKTTEEISRLCSDHIYKLTNKIRTNKELALFITCLFDLSKYREEYFFPNVKIYYESDESKAVVLAKSLSDYTYIGYTPSIYNHSLDFQISPNNTHNVIGQEFENVCMIIDNNFSYVGNKLVGKTHPNPDYIFEKLLYQGLTRVRSKLAIIITEEEILNYILNMNFTV